MLVFSIQHYVHCNFGEKSMIDDNCLQNTLQSSVLFAEYTAVICVTNRISEFKMAATSVLPWSRLMLSTVQQVYYFSPLLQLV